jgi:diadenosine tetraphosphate (Ap4A) HIT family hydrolase
MVPHIHWHVIPRFKDDAFYPGSAWSKRVQETPEAILLERRRSVAELPEAIKAEITTLS